MKAVLSFWFLTLVAVCLPAPLLADSDACLNPYEEYYVQADQEGTQVRVSWWESFSPSELEEHSFEEMRRRLVRENGCGIEVIFEFTLAETASSTKVYPYCQLDWDEDETYEFVVYDLVCVPNGEATYTVEKWTGVDDSGDDVWLRIWYPEEVCVRGNTDECDSCGKGFNGACAESGCSFLPGRPTVPFVSVMLAIGLTLLILSRGRRII